jgi:predicted naringenin-chalcone synthase
MNHVYIHNFMPVELDYKMDQDFAIRWLSSTMNTDKETVNRYSCKSNKIKTRQHIHGDLAVISDSERTLFKSEFGPQTASLTQRSDYIKEISHKVFQKLYTQNELPPDHIFHVTCTGYHSPSPGQVRVNENKWTDLTKITHLYHMGCFAALKAIQTATAHLQYPDTDHVSVAHTEYCTMHLNPEANTPEQLVIQSLFADGVIRYDLTTTSEDNRCFKLIRQNEVILPNTAKLMTWDIKDWGFSMTLDKRVPFYFKKEIWEFTKNLLQSENWEDVIFAIHPGGPAIIESVAEELKLKPWQIAHSQETLLNYGNMSSATLPHIWDLILNDTDIRKETKVVSLAFGPGLTLIGSVFEVA